jgi:hypothetical protein
LAGPAAAREFVRAAMESGPGFCYKALAGDLPLSLE